MKFQVYKLGLAHFLEIKSIVCLISLTCRGLTSDDFYLEAKLTKCILWFFHKIHGEAHGEAERINLKVNWIPRHSWSSFLKFSVEMQTIKRLEVILFETYSWWELWRNSCHCRRHPSWGRQLHFLNIFSFYYFIL